MEIAPVTPDRWDDLIELFQRKGPRGGTPIPDNCWCMWWRQRTGNRGRNKHAMRGLVREGREPGLLAYEDGSPVGWVSVGPREEFGQLMRSRTYGPRDEDSEIFSIVCFYIDPRARRRGVTAALLEAAVEYALRHGARAVEAYGSEAPDYMGTRKLFEAAGFRAQRAAGKRTVMRYERRRNRRRPSKGRG